MSYEEEVVVVVVVEDQDVPMERAPLRQAI